MLVKRASCAGSPMTGFSHRSPATGLTGPGSAIAILHPYLTPVASTLSSVRIRSTVPTPSRVTVEGRWLRPDRPVSICSRPLPSIGGAAGTVDPVCSESDVRHAVGLLPPVRQSQMSGFGRFRVSTSQRASPEDRQIK